MRNEKGEIGKAWVRTSVTQVKMFVKINREEIRFGRRCLPNFEDDGFSRQLGAEIGVPRLGQGEVEHPSSRVRGNPPVVGVVRRKGEVADVDEIHTERMKEER